MKEDMKEKTRWPFGRRRADETEHLPDQADVSQADTVRFAQKRREEEEKEKKRETFRENRKAFHRKNLERHKKLFDCYRDRFSRAYDRMAETEHLERDEYGDEISCTGNLANMLQLFQLIEKDIRSIEELDGQPTREAEMKAMEKLIRPAPNELVEAALVQKGRIDSTCEERNGMLLLDSGDGPCQIRTIFPYSRRKRRRYAVQSGFHSVLNDESLPDQYIHADVAEMQIGEPFYRLSNESDDFLRSGDEIPEDADAVVECVRMTYRGVVFESRELIERTEDDAFGSRTGSLAGRSEQGSCREKIRRRRKMWRTVREDAKYAKCISASDDAALMT